MGRITKVIAFAALACACTPVFADDSAKPDAKAAWDAAMKAAVLGPTDVTMRDQAKLHLPGTMFFVPPENAAPLMRAWGNSVGDNSFGLVFPKSENESWFISLDHVADGYVKDDDAKTWNADDLLQSLRDGTEAQNAERIKLGIPAMDIVGWVQAPKYDAGSHQLIWSLKSLDRGGPSDQVANINYNTYKLGRDGYFEVDLVTNEKSVGVDKMSAQAVLDNLEYNQGKRYSDYVEGTDHVAEYGLAALVAGVAAKKLGLLALGGLFLAKFAKIIAVAAAVAGGSVLKFFRRGNKSGA